MCKVQVRFHRAKAKESEGEPVAIAKKANLECAVSIAFKEATAKALAVRWARLP